MDRALRFTVGLLFITVISASAQVTFTGYPIPNGAYIGIVAGPDGNLWFPENTSPSNNNIAGMTPAGVITGNFAPPPSAELGPGTYGQQITVGPDGNLWVTYSRGDVIGKITPAGAITLFSIIDPVNPSLDA